MELRLHEELVEDFSTSFIARHVVSPRSISFSTSMSPKRRRKKFTYREFVEFRGGEMKNATIGCWKRDGTFERSKTEKVNWKLTSCNGERHFRDLECREACVVVSSSVNDTSNNR